MGRYLQFTGQKGTALREAAAAAVIIFVFWLLDLSGASAQSCDIDGQRYNLTADTVEWSMKIESGGSCVRGIRFNNVAIEKIKLISPPLNGEVALQGPGFRYLAKANFSGQDSFSLAVFGTIHQ